MKQILVPPVTSIHDSKKPDEMDAYVPGVEQQNDQALATFEEVMGSEALSPNDQWSTYKGTIYSTYIQQNNTLEKTMQLIEEQGGPQARYGYLVCFFFQLVFFKTANCEKQQANLEVQT